MRGAVSPLAYFAHSHTPRASLALNKRASERSGEKVPAHLACRRANSTSLGRRSAKASSRELASPAVFVCSREESVYSPARTDSEREHKRSRQKDNKERRERDAPSLYTTAHLGISTRCYSDAAVYYCCSCQAATATAVLTWRSCARLRSTCGLRARPGTQPTTSPGEVGARKTIRPSIRITITATTGRDKQRQ